MLANLDLQLVLLFNHHDWAFGTLILRTEGQINITWGHSSETCWFVSSCLAQTCWFVAASACMQNFGIIQHFLFLNARNKQNKTHNGVNGHHF